MSDELKLGFRLAFDHVLSLEKADDLPDADLDRWGDDASEADRWIVQMLNTMGLWPKPKDFQHVGMRALAFGVLIGSTLEEPEESKEDPTWVRENLHKLLDISAYPEHDAFEGSANVDFVRNHMLVEFALFDDDMQMDTINDMIAWMALMVAKGILAGKFMLHGAP